MEDLFQKYQMTEAQKGLVNGIKNIKNLPTFIEEMDDVEQLIWVVAVATIDMPKEPTDNDLKFYKNAVDERVRRLEEAERRYGWFSLKWNKTSMRRLITNWFCGIMVIDPNLKTKDGSPIQFVYEYYGPESKYPDKEHQTDDWKKEGIDFYVLMARSICRTYPEATSKGIVSFSDMSAFDWEKYDMETKTRHSEIGSLIPNKLTRMITVRPDDKMRGFYKDMTPRARKKFGFVVYEDFGTAIEAEGDFLPREMPHFVGGTLRVDILKCLKHLFSQEPDALKLLLETFDEMEKACEIPQPKHME